MKKYRGVLLSVSVAAMLLGACPAVYAEETESVSEVVEEVVEEVAEEAEVVLAEGEISESDKAQLEALADQILQMVTLQADEIVNPSSVLAVYPDGLVAGATAYKAVSEELGAYAGIESSEIEVDDEIVISAVANFENDSNTVTITLDKEQLGTSQMIDGITFSTADQSLGQKMKEAVLNTLMGVCIVFLMLLFLSALISQFKHISKLEAALAKKKAPAATPAPAKAAPVVAPVVEEEVVDDGELIAVIAAAIAAAEGTSTDGFVVRSIKKSNRNKWQRA